MNDKIKPRSLTFCLVMVVLLVFTSIMPVTAVNKDPENLGLGAPVQAGDVIICSTPIKVTYYDSSGTRITTVSGTEQLEIVEQYDPETGANYKDYTVTAVTASERELKLSLTGIPPKDQLPLEHDLTEIIIKKAPDKTVYTEGESFSRSGMVVRAFYSDNRWRNTTKYTVDPSGPLSIDTSCVTITVKEGDISKSVTQNITVHSKEYAENSNAGSFNIYAVAAAGGSISDSGNRSVNRGGSRTYTITPHNGYRINYVEVDGNHVGAVSSYTFNNVHESHTIRAYFLSGSDENNLPKKKLSVIGSFSGVSGEGMYTPGTKVNIDAGSVPGFAFAGWIASDGITYPMPALSYVMPAYDVLLYANWVQSEAPNALSQITTTNLKGPQLSGWSDITNKLATFHIEDLEQGSSPVLKATLAGPNCYIDAQTIAALNTRQGLAFEVSYGNDASFTFYSDMDNTQFTGTDLNYSCNDNTALFFHEKSLTFTQPGAINTGICINLFLPDAQTGQIAYVYLVNENGTEMMYLPAIVDNEKKISFPISLKTDLSIKY